MSGSTPYKIRTEDPEEIVYECNRVFSLITDRLDKIEGFRGQPELHNTMVTEFDIVVAGASKGFIMRDNSKQRNYWRLEVTGDGTLTITQIGRSY